MKSNRWPEDLRRRTGVQESSLLMNILCGSASIALRGGVGAAADSLGQCQVKCLSRIELDNFDILSLGVDQLL